MNIKDNTGKLYYVGGCVRDEILGIPSLDFDICFEGDAIDYVKSQNFKIIKTQEDIRTARVLLDDEEIDFASTRKEIYPKQGHLPVTTEIGCTLKEDLIRRDFTINSIAKSVKTGEIFDPTGGLDDIKLKQLRVHHENSFKDDPTRILRALKFSLRFGFNLEENTKKLQEEYLANVNPDMSYSRLKKELIDTFNLNLDEALERLINEKIYKLLTPELPTAKPSNIEGLVKEFNIQNPWIIYLGWLDLSKLDLTKEEKKVLEDFERLKNINTTDDFEVYKNCKKSDIKAIVLWIAMGSQAGLKYLRELQHVKIECNGEDLIKLGLNGKEIGEALDKILQAKLKVPNLTKDEELYIIKLR